MLGGVVGNLPPTQITKRLIASAIDMDNPLTPGFDKGFDFKTGHGFVQADVIFEQLKNRVRSQSALAVTTASALDARVNGDSQLTNGAQASVYPNPSTGQVTFNVVSDKNKAIDVIVMDLSGREVLRIAGIQNLSLTKDLSALPKGMYITKFAVDGCGTTTQKLVIQ
jgi:hypothetical protein